MWTFKRLLGSSRGFLKVISISTLVIGGGTAAFPTFTAFAAVSIESNFRKPDPKQWMCSPITPIKELNDELDSSYRAKMEALCMQLQGQLCREMEKVDGRAKFRIDKWNRQSGGGGISCVLEDGAVFEKACVNISAIHGTLGPSAMKEMRARHDLPTDRDCKFFACGISSVVHPVNPFVPTNHFNFRYFEVDLGNGKKCWWYGGGSDLTPYYLFEEDAQHFHSQLKQACDQHDKSYYNRFKQWCDEYFFLKHRGECRGIGGIFFDDLEGESQQKIFEFVRSCAESIVPAYLPIVEKRKDMHFGEQERDWQLLRRGRYVEFNLIYDRGTKFGLATPEARVESILLSLPRYAKWVYCHDSSGDSRNKQLLEVLESPRQWV